jgi:hypothetical protein
LRSFINIAGEIIFLLNDGKIFDFSLEHEETLYLIEHEYSLLRGKQWQTTPKNLPRIQRARAIPVA